MIFIKIPEELRGTITTESNQNVDILALFWCIVWSALHKTFPKAGYLQQAGFVCHFDHADY